MESGTVKFFSQRDGYAIVSSDRGGEAYLHPKIIAQAGLSMKQGDRVRFLSRPDRRGGQLPFIATVELA